LKGFGNSDIKWNFTKFLVNSDGKPIKRFAPLVTPEKIDNTLEKIFDSN
jgi:glutathione peroxidase